MELKKDEIRDILKYLDSLIKRELEIIICGGVAGILVLNLQRGTQDIDIVSSIPKLSEFQKALDQVAERFGLSERWLNDSSKGFIDYLPRDYSKRLKEVDLGLRRIRVRVLSKVDFFIMKLAAFRPEDISDIKDIRLSESDVKTVISAIDGISRFDRGKALTMQKYLEETGLWKA